MKTRTKTRTRIKNTEKSKYRFSKLLTYIDSNKKRYFYEGKAMGCFQFLTIDSNGINGMFTGYERDMDKLNLTIKN